MSEIEYKQGDTIPIEASLPPDLTEAISVEFHMESLLSNTSISGEANVVEDTVGDVVYYFSDGETDELGPHRIEWEIEWSDGQIESFPKGDYDELYISRDVS